MTPRLLHIAIMAAAAAVASAGEPADSCAVERSSMKAVTVDLGGIRSADTYLSPLFYTGFHVRLGFENWRAMRFDPPRWGRQIVAGITYDCPENPAGNNRLHTLLIDFDFRMLRRQSVAPVEGLTLHYGGAAGFDGGVTYNPRNSNNVCSPQVYFHADLTGMATYRARLGKVPVTLRYQATIPVAGVFFLPDYDQSFYEIYLGNYGPAINFSWWKNRFDMENLLTADFHTGSAIWRIGYRNEATTVWENNISVRRMVHSVVVGVAWESVAFDPRRRGPSEKARVISAFY